MWLRVVPLLLLASALPAGPHSRDLDDLGSEFEEARVRARSRLARAGEEVVPLLIEAYRGADYVTRAGILDILADRRTAGALPLVLDDLGTGSRTVREAQARVMVALGEPARQALEEILGGGDARRVAWAREVRALMVRVTVERTILAEILEPALHYRGQYAHLNRDRSLAAEVLLDMVANDRGGYRFMVPVEHVIDILEIRTKAADALTDVGRPEDLERILALHSGVRLEWMGTRDFRRRRALEGLAEDLAYVLHGLGYRGPAEDLARELWDQTRERGYSYDFHRKRFNLALALSRMGLHRPSERLYREILADSSAQDDHAGAAYNLACVLSLLGRVDDAYGALLDSVRLEPLGVKPALEDGDLQAVRDAYPDLERRLVAAAPRLPGDEEPEGLEPPR